ncbi:MAG: hypothetical protein ABI850_09005 [Flavobacterium sp.]
MCAEFWLSFKVSSKAFSKWHKTEFGINPINDVLDEGMGWNIKDCKSAIINNKKQLHCQIINEKERENVLATLKNNILNLGIPYLANFGEIVITMVFFIHLLKRTTFLCTIYFTKSKIISIFEND